tara:strand:- start:308 stop:604 length:297 start_codon:yes stop_codon:yes gene_type:complete
MAKAKKDTVKKTTKTVAKRNSLNLISARGVIVSKTLGDVRKNCLKIGDSQLGKYQATEDIGHAIAALAGYKQALDSTKTQLVYQRISGRVKKIPFCEE